MSDGKENTPNFFSYREFLQNYGVKSLSLALPLQSSLYTVSNFQKLLRSFK